MLGRKAGSWRSRLAIWYDSWLLAQTRRRWLRHGTAVMTVPGWASPQIRQLVYQLNVERAAQKWTERIADDPLAKWVPQMDAAADTMRGAIREVGKLRD